MTAQPPEMLGNYRIGPAVGQGDMGTVYKAQDTASQQLVALKILNRVDTSSIMSREAAVELIEFASSLAEQSERLYPILACLNDEEHELIAIVKPFAKARSIQDHLAKGKPIPTKQAFRIVSQIASALQFLHGQELAHGSVRSSNVLLDEKGNAFLTDLPMAHLREMGLVSPEGPTILNQYYTQPNFAYNASPEVAGDIFAFGVLTYHILTARIPFDDPDPRARPDPPSPEGLPELIYTVLLRAMTERKRLRYDSIKAFMRDLQGAVKGEIDPETKQLFSISGDKFPDDEEEE